MDARAATWLAWSLCALSLTLTALSYLLIALNLSLDAPVYFYWLEPTTIAIGYSVIGAVIASRLPYHPIGWICCAIGLTGAVEHLSSEYAIYALLAHPEALAGGNAMLWLCNWVWIVMFGLIVYLILLFPNGRLPSSRWRWFSWFSVALTLLAATLMAISPDAALDVLGSSDNAHISLPNPLGIGGLPDLYRPVQTLVLALGMVGAASVVVGRRSVRGIERQQMKWLLYASAIFFVGNVLKNTVLSPSGGVSWDLWVGYLLVAVGGLGGPISIGIAILRYRLYEIDTLINRTLVYGSLTTMLVAIYFGVVATAQEIFQVLTGQAQQSQLAIVVSTLAIAALFTPLRRTIQPFIDRRFYRSTYDAAKTLEAFSVKLRDETDLDALNADLIGGGQRDYAACSRLLVATPRHTTEESRSAGVIQQAPWVIEVFPVGSSQEFMILMRFLSCTLMPSATRARGSSLTLGSPILLLGRSDPSYGHATVATPPYPPTA